MAFEIENVAVEVSRQGVASKYAQLHDLEVGQSFVVPYNKPVEGQTADEAKEKQLGALRGVVQQYQAKYAEKTGETKQNRKGDTVDVTVPTKRAGVQADKKGFRLGRTA